MNEPLPPTREELIAQLREIRQALVDTGFDDAEFAGAELPWAVRKALTTALRASHRSLSPNLQGIPTLSGLLDAAGRELFAVLWAQRHTPSAEYLPIADVVAEQAARADWPKLPDTARAAWSELARQVLEAAIEGER